MFLSFSVKIWWRKGLKRERQKERRNSEEYWECNFCYYLFQCPAASRELLQVRLGHVFLSVPLRRTRSLAWRVHNLTNPEVIRWELTIRFWQLGAQKRVRLCQKIALVLATSLLPENWKQNICFTQAFNRASMISFLWILMLLKLCSTCRRELYLRKISCWG